MSSKFPWAHKVNKNDRRTRHGPRHTISGLPNHFPILLNKSNFTTVIRKCITLIWCRLFVSSLFRLTLNVRIYNSKSGKHSSYRIYIFFSSILTLKMISVCWSFCCFFFCLLFHFLHRFWIFRFSVIFYSIRCAYLYRNGGKTPKRKMNVHGP